MGERRKAALGGNQGGKEILAPSDSCRNGRAAVSERVFLSFGEILTRNCGVTVRRPQSNARSWMAFKHRPFLGFVRFAASTDQGTIWLAVSSWGVANPVMQHRRS